MSSQVLLSVQPRTAMSDVPLAIAVSGLLANSAVTIRASFTDGGGVEWAAQADYRADAKGDLDLSASAPITDSFTEADPMGLIWSMLPVDEVARENMQLRWSDLDTAVLTFALLQDGETITSVEARRMMVAPGVERVEVRDRGLFGTLFLPAGAGPHPAITIISGSGGGLNEARAALFAAHGYAGFALAYFNYETLPDSIYQIPLEYFETSIAYLGSRADIDGGRLAITGGSRGGELSLLLGSIFPQYKVIIADVPSGIVWGGFGKDRSKGSVPAWTWRGEEIPYMDDEVDPTVYDYHNDYRERGEPIPLTPGFRELLRRSPATAKRAEIPVEKIRGAVLMVSGADDAMWHSSELAEVAMDRLRAHNFSRPYEHISYPGAGHLIMPPYAPTTLVASKHPVDGGFYAFGGEPHAIYKAGVDAWRRKLDFLRQHL